VYGTSRRQDAVDKGYLPLDLADPTAGDAPLPFADVAFFCAAMAQFAECRNNPVLARRVNVLSPVALAKRLSSQGTRVVLLSTGAIYDGSIPRVPADRRPCPTTEYGRSKAEAEAEFLSLGTIASVVRLTKVLEPSHPLIGGWINALAKGATATAYSDLGLAPISLAESVTALMIAAADPAGGIYQASAADDISYFDAARHIASRLNVDPHNVVAQRGAEAGIASEQLTLLSSLDTSRLSAVTGRAAPDPFGVIDDVFGAAIAQARSTTTTPR
jgi:dTDP-4-dehydrorhamnose reductase